MNNKISVAMCTYNGSKYLLEQLKSIQAQTRSPDELIICDDVSTDRTIEIINSFTKICSFPIYLYQNQKNLGSSKNFEQAIKLCSGSIIFLADQDDVWKNNKIATIENIFIAKPEIDLIFSDADIVDDKLSPLGYSLWDSIGFNSKQENTFKELDLNKIIKVLLKRDVMTGATMAFRSKIINSFIPIPSSWIHDAWIAHFSVIYFRTLALKEPLILYRQHGEQQVGASKAKFYRRILMLFTVNINVVYKDKGRYEILLKRLFNNSLGLVDRDIILLIQSKCSHLDRRWKIQNTNHLTRIFYTIQEILNQRYFRYSKGLRSLLKDLVITHDKA